MYGSYSVAYIKMIVFIRHLTAY